MARTERTKKAIREFNRLLTMARRRDNTKDPNKAAEVTFKMRKVNARIDRIIDRLTLEEMADYSRVISRAKY